MNWTLILILALIIGGGFFAYQNGYIKFDGDAGKNAGAADTPSVSVQGVSLANSQ